MLPPTRSLRAAAALAIALSIPTILSSHALALTIAIDYRYDTANFFDTAQKRAAMEAAAARWSAIVNHSLMAVSVTDDGLDARIGFNHPATGQEYQVSAANSRFSDGLANFELADEYRGAWSIPADTLVVYVGGRDLNFAAVASTGTGLNFTTVTDNPNGVHNRGFNVGIDSLPVWGGSISFDNSASTNFHFDLSTPSFGNRTDFYTIALHEIAHILGVSNPNADWEVHFTGNGFAGTNAIAAFNADNAASVTALEVNTSQDTHWKDGMYQAFIFPTANPNLIGTLGTEVLQDLLMEPTANFTNEMRRLEVTNVDVGAVKDVGWSTVSAPELRPIEIWRQTHFGTSANAGTAANDNDADDDGRANLLEYAMGTSPVAAESGTITHIASESSIGLRFPRNPGASDVILHVQSSALAVQWQTVAISDRGGPFVSLVPGEIAVGETGPATAKTVELNDSKPLQDASPRRFLRLQATVVEE